MDFHQGRDRRQSDHQPSAGLPMLQLVDQQQQQQSHASAFSLFAPEPSSSINKTTISTPSLSLLPRIGYFTWAQWQELELQALIYKYMITGVPVPLELVLPIRRSLLNSSPYYHHPELYQHLQPSLLQTGYWGRCVADPEPGRCRRTDGKKWRCSREFVVGHKYCERHVHRSRNRSRKHVEIPTPSINSSKTPLSSPSELAKENYFSLSGPTPTIDILHLNQRHPDVKTMEKSLQSNSINFCLQELQDNKHEGYVLQRFFDEWPKCQRELNDPTSYAGEPTSTTHLSISIPGDAPSDFSLKLSTGNAEARQESNNVRKDGRMVQPTSNWSGWGRHGEASMGGPLAEVLRSSTSTHSPISVLHKPNGSMSESSSISPSETS